MPGFARSVRHRTRRTGALALAALAVASGLSVTDTAYAHRAHASGTILGIWEVQSLSGAGNNKAHPDWGQAGKIYPRVAPANYADGVGQPVSGPNPRYVSNRIVNDTGTVLYSPRGVSQWAFVWGQFVDHTFALRLGRRQSGEPGETANIPVNVDDPLESFPNRLGMLFFERSIPAPGTGVTVPRESINQISSYLNAAAVYSNTDARLDWMREGSVDGDPANNQARLLMPGDYLPRRDSRGNPEASPSMVVGGHLVNTPFKAAVAGDQRANENPALLATQTLFAREHNRIVAALPGWLSQEDKFQIARAVVIAEQQYITYNEYLPALGVSLPPYSGYKPTVNTEVTNEFATVGFRGHSQIRGKFVIESAAGRYSQATLDSLRSMGVTVTVDGDDVELVVPLGEDAFFRPDLLEAIQLGPLLEGIGRRPQAKNDEQIDNLLRSFPFELSGDPACREDPELPQCVTGFNDLAAVDIERGRDHGMPTYNQLRAAYGLPAKSSFKAITGEQSEAFPADPELTPGAEIDDPDSLDFTALYDAAGNPTTFEADDATRGVRRTPLAARLKAIYQDVGKVDAFVGMSAEPNLPGRDFGETQLAIWRKQFAALRDGDRFFYANDPMLHWVKVLFGIDYRHSLGDLIALNTDIPRGAMASNVFLAQEAPVRGRPAEVDTRTKARAGQAPAGPGTRKGAEAAAGFRPPGS
ncbi:peroxidase family protein [Nonomuraea sp. B12E4]|uniref:peroxidase family protein n=1 Tax=Nonomuraea sp. B12E4 TaxID=3153564 RepID=UPI00325F0771